MDVASARRFERRGVGAVKLPVPVFTAPVFLGPWHIVRCHASSRMTVSIQLTEKDFIAAQRLHFRPKPALRWTAYALLAIFGGMLLQEVLLMIQGAPLSKGWWVLPAGLAYGGFLFFILLPWRVGRIYRQTPALAKPTELTFSDGGIGIGSGTKEIRFPWKAFSQWKRNRDTILVYHSGSHFHTLPRHAFSSAEEFDALAVLLTQHIGPPKL